MKPWCSMERMLLSLVLRREKSCKVHHPEVTMRAVSFQLPSDGAECFRRLDAGCWYSGVPSTGTLRDMLRVMGLLVKKGALQLPGDDVLRQDGFLAADPRFSSEGCFRKIRLWWIDKKSPRAVRITARFRTAFTSVSEKACNGRE